MHLVPFIIVIAKIGRVASGLSNLKIQSGCWRYCIIFWLLNMVKSLLLVFVGCVLILWGMEGVDDGVILGLGRYSRFVSKEEAPFRFYLSACSNLTLGSVCIVWAIKNYRKI